MSESSGAVRLSRRALLRGTVAVGAAATLGVQSGCGSTAAPPITLVRGGQPNAVIVWWTLTQSAVPRFAASELARYVAQMSGATLAVRQGQLASGGAARSGLLVATGALAQSMEHSPTVPAGWVAPLWAKLSAAQNDAFAISTVNGDTLALIGSVERGTLYAVYELLGQLGVRFFAPTFNYYQGRSELVPHLRTVSTAPINDLQEASLQYRRLYVEEGWSHNATNLPQLVDWMAKAKLNILVYPYNYGGFNVTEYDTFRGVVAPALASRGMIAEVGGHGFQSWLPQSQYPQYYEGNYNVFDTGNQTAVQQYISGVTTYLRQHPEIRIFDAWPPDGATWPPNAVAPYGNVPNAEDVVIRQLTRAVSTQLPGVMVEEIAYGPATTPPSPEYMYSGTNNIIDISDSGRSYQVPIYDPGSNQNAYYVRLVKQWRQLFSGPIGMYTYYVKYCWHSLPCNLLKLVALDMPYYHSIGTNGLGTYCEPANWLCYEPVHAEIAALSWNIRLDSTTWRQSFLSDRYGPAAGVIGTYLTQVEQAGRTLFASSCGQYGSLQAVTQALSDFQAAQQALTLASKAAPAGSDAAFMVQRLTWSIAFAIADTQISYYHDRGDLGQEAAAKAQTAQLVTQYRFTGVVLENSYLTSRYGPGVTRPAMAAMYRSPACGFIQSNPQVVLAPGGKASVTIAAQSVDYLAHTVHWSVAAPAGISVSPPSGSLAVTGAGIATQTVTLTLAAGMAGGDYQTPVSFVTDHGAALPQATVSVSVPAQPGKAGPLPAYYDNVGITDNGSPKLGNFDGYGNSYSAQALAVAGITPGGQVTHGGVTFTWPNLPAGTADNVVANGQTIEIKGSGATLGFLGASSDAVMTSGAGSISYTDGTTQAFTLTLTGWDQTTTDGGNAVIATTKYRNRTRPGNTAGVSVFYAGIPLSAGKTVQSVTLPVINSSASPPAQMHIFGVGIG